MKELSKQEAIDFGESGAWKEMTPEARGIFQLYQECLCMPFEKFHEGIEAALGRPVWTHAMRRDDLIAELEGKKDIPSMQEIIDMIPEEKRIIFVIEGDGNGEIHD